ncbi:MAG: hypothetical protein ABI853_05880 [Sphingomicrobium sp.]
MDPTIIIAVLVVIVLALGGLLYFQRHRSDKLRSRFGPEYDRAVKESGGKSKAEAKLVEREKRVKSLSIRPLEPSDRARFTRSWQNVQAEFVDDPEGSIGHADSLLAEVMSARGYPVSDFEQISADISVDHPDVVQNYRAAHEIALRHERGQANTEDLRLAMIHYRSLFEDLVTDAKAPDAPAIGGKDAGEKVARIRATEAHPTREKVK